MAIHDYYAEQSSLLHVVEVHNASDGEVDLLFPPSTPKTSKGTSIASSRARFCKIPYVV